MGKLIDEDSVISSICSFCDRWDCDYNCPKVQEIRKISPVQPERKKGHWIRHEYADIVEGYYVPNYECSECHSWKEDDSDFCPDCGTDMR